MKTAGRKVTGQIYAKTFIMAAMKQRMGGY